MRPTTPNDIVEQFRVSWIIFASGHRYMVDTADLPRLRQHHWYVGPMGRLSTHRGRSRDTLYASRFLACAERDQMVRHIDKDVHNLRLSNLEVVPYRKSRRKYSKGLDAELRRV